MLSFPFAAVLAPVATPIQMHVSRVAHFSIGIIECELIELRKRRRVVAATASSACAVAVLLPHHRSIRAPLTCLLSHRTRRLPTLAPFLCVSPPMLVDIPVSSQLVAG